MTRVRAAINLTPLRYRRDLYPLLPMLQIRNWILSNWTPSAVLAYTPARTSSGLMRWRRRAAP